MEVLAARLKWLREKYRYGQKEVASVIGITTSGYQKIEHNLSNPKLELLIELAQFYKVSTDFLLGLSDELIETDHIIEEIMELESLRQDNYRELAEVSHRINQMRHEKTMAGVYQEDYYDEIISEKVAERNHKESKQFELDIKYSRKILEYIETIINLPNPKPWENKVIKRLLPIDVYIQNNLFDEFTIFLSGNNGFQVDYSTYKDLEVAENKKEYLESILNKPHEKEKL